MRQRKHFEIRILPFSSGFTMVVYEKIRFEAYTNINTIDTK